MFANHGVVGEPGNYNIRGVWMWKGPGMLELLLDENSAAEYYKYT